MGHLGVQEYLAAGMLGPVGLVVVLLVAGLAALAAELFILPGFGVAGVIGALLLIAGIITSWVHFGAFWGGLAVAATIVISVAMFVFMFRSKAMRKRLVLETQLKPGGGTASQDLEGLVGKMGETKTDLRPAGIATVDGNRLDVVSEGGYIDRGTRVRVIEIDGPRVIVTRID
jgi:membrane-bound serine protease (ClpP class)